MLAPLRRCVAEWQCMIGQVRKPKIGTRSNLKNPSTVSPSSHRDKHFYLLKLLSNVNRAAYKWFTQKSTRTARRHPPRPSPV